MLQGIEEIFVEIKPRLGIEYVYQQCEAAKTGFSRLPYRVVHYNFCEWIN